MQVTEKYLETKTNNKTLTLELAQKDKIIKKTVWENENLNRNLRSTQVEPKETKVFY